MPAIAMNHFTILTDDVDGTLAFYADMLDLHPGARPPFTFPGAWLYARDGKDPILHVIGGKPKGDLVKGVIDHMAFTGKDLAGAVEKLKARGVPGDFSFIVRQNGMFSYSGLSEEQVTHLREKFGVYAVSGGRICVAALNSKNIDYVADAIASILT